MKKLLFVFNPHSGTGEISKHLAEAVDIFTKSGYEVVAYPTQCGGDGKRKIIEDGPRFDRIVVSGGDGTLHELVNTITSLPSSVSFGYIPTGTVNDFAITNKIPKNNVIDASKIAAGDNVKTLDIGKFGDEYFSYVAAFGIATNIAYDTDQKAKNTWGFMAYLAHAVKTLNFTALVTMSKKMTIKTDTETLEGEFIFGAISNTLSIGGMPNLTVKDVVLDDGLLEGIFIKRPETLLDIDEMSSALLFRELEADSIICVRSSRFEITSEPVAWTLDGENGGEHENITVSAENRALRMALPSEPAEVIKLPPMWNV